MNGWIKPKILIFFQSYSPVKVRHCGNIYYIFDFRSYSLVKVHHCGNIYYIFNFWSYSPVKVRHCGNIYYNFGHIHHANVRHCQFVGHVHQFWSYSFSHLDSVKWITLKILPIVLNLNVKSSRAKRVIKIWLAKYRSWFLTNSCCSLFIKEAFRIFVCLYFLYYFLFFLNVSGIF